MKNIKLNTPASRALLVSIALHMALLAAAALLVYRSVPSVTDSPGVVQVSLLPVFDGLDETPDAGAEADEDDAAPSEPVPDVAVAEVEEIAAPSPDEPPVEADEPETLAEAPDPAAPDSTQADTGEAPGQLADETARDEPEPVAEDTAPEATVVVADEPASDPTEPAESPDATAGETTIVLDSDPELVAADIETDPDPLAAEAATEASAAGAEAPPVPTAPVSDIERRVLEREVADFARSFVALGDWQPATTWTHRGREYTATVTRLPAEGSMGIDEAIVVVTTERDGEQVSTEMRMQRLSFSHFAQFVDRWDDRVQIHDDVIDGRFHSNGEINVTRSRGVQPTFTGKVTTARGINTSMSERSVRRSEVFQGGLETRAGRIALPNRVLLFADDDSIDPDRVQRFSAPTRIEFLADGSYQWSTVRSSNRRWRGEPDPEPVAADGRRDLSDEPHYLIAADDSPLYVRGTLDGKVLVYSPADIVIEGDLKYAAHPASIADSDDYLGLVSEGNVEIAAPDVTGPGDLTVHAAIYARRVFAVRNFRSTPAGTLYVVGSVTAGSITATEPRFSTQLSFDTRLADLRPPRFPQTDRFEIASWDGNWTLE